MNDLGEREKNGAWLGAALTGKLDYGKIKAALARDVCIVLLLAARFR